MRSVSRILIVLALALTALPACGKSGDAPASSAGNSIIPRRQPSSPTTDNSISLAGAHVTRGDVSTQSAGLTSDAIGNQGYVSRKTSVGGSYLQLREVGSAHYHMSAGLYGHAQATQ